MKAQSETQFYQGEGQGDYQGPYSLVMICTAHYSVSYFYTTTPIND